MKYSYYRIVLTAVLIAAMTAGTLEAWTITPASASPAELHVGPGQPYATIQDAIDAASVGDTIIVHPWTYNEVINVTKDNLTIESTSGPEETIIDATGIPLNYEVGIVNVVGKSAVTIEGFTLKGAIGKKYIAGIYLINNTGCAFSNNIITDISGETTSMGITCMGIGLWGSCSDNVFVNIKIINITGFYPCGIIISSHPHVGWANNNSFTNTIIDGINSISPPPSSPLWVPLSHGIHLDFGRRNTFTNTTLKNINCDGIWVENSVSNTFTDTTISNLTGLGIGISGSWTASDNFFKNTHMSGTTNGIHVGWYSSNTTLYGGEILSERGGKGIGVSGREAGAASITGFNITGADYGVEMFGYIALVKVNHCNIYNNEYGIFFNGTCTYETCVKVNYCSIYNNTKYGVFFNGTCTDETCIDATLNWWGDPSGPHHPTLNPSGKGDKVSDNVLFKPWLDAPIGMRGPALRVSNLSISPIKVKIGEAVSISVNVTNTGDVTGTFAVTLRVNDAVEAIKELTLSGRESVVVTFEVAKDVAGTYDVEVDGSTGTFMVREPRKAEFKVTNLSISPAVVEVGEGVIISINITNLGEVKGTYTLSLKINDVTEVAKDVTLAGETSIIEIFTIIKDIAGDYTVKVDGLTNTFTVIAPKPAEKETPLLPPWELYATIAVVAIVTLGVATIIYRRRRASS